MAEHDLKTWPDAFEAIADGRKRFEWRKSDRDFAVGDTLRLREYAPRMDNRDYTHFGGEYTGREIVVRVTYLLKGSKHAFRDGGRFGVPDGYCVMSIDLPATPGEGAK